MNNLPLFLAENSKQTASEINSSEPSLYSDIRHQLQRDN